MLFAGVACNDVLLLFFEAVRCVSKEETIKQSEWVSKSPSQQDLFPTVVEVTPVCAAGGQLDQRGAERRRSTGSSFQRSDHGSGRGGSGR